MTKVIRVSDANVGDVVIDIRRPSGVFDVGSRPISLIHDLGGSNGRGFRMLCFDFWDFYVLADEYELTVESVRPPVCPVTYPHVCPRCGRPAYIGFNAVDCSGGCA